MRQKIAPIDGSQNDIRLIVSEEGWSEDAGLVVGEPVDPPDESPGWQLVDFWVEYDEEQVTEERDVGGKKSKVVVTRKAKPQLHALWVKPKTAPKKARAKPKGKTKPAPEPKATATAEKPAEQKAPKEAKRRVGRKATKKVKVTVADDVPPEFVAGLCEHTAQMLVDTINVGEKRPVTGDDARAYTPLCHQCQKLHSVLETATGSAPEA